jgi:hypothetical protein
MHKDYLGNIIEVGDTILRPMWAQLQERTVAKVTPKAIFVQSELFTIVDGKITQIPSTTRISVPVYRPDLNFINLTKIRR